MLQSIYNIGQKCIKWTVYHLSVRTELNNVWWMQTSRKVGRHPIPLPFITGKFNKQECLKWLLITVTHKINMQFPSDLLWDPCTMLTPQIGHKKGTILAAYSSMHFGNLTNESPCYIRWKEQSKYITKNGMERKTKTSVCVTWGKGMAIDIPGIFVLHKFLQSR